MDKVTARSVRAEPNAVVSAAQVCLVFWVTVDITNFLVTVSKLALLAILASAVLLERTAHFGLVARSLGYWRGNRGSGRSLTLASVQQGATGSNWAIPIKAR